MLRMRNLGSMNQVTGSTRKFLMEPVTSGLPTMLRMRNLGSADQVTGSIRIVVTVLGKDSGHSLGKDIVTVSKRI